MKFAIADIKQLLRTVKLCAKSVAKSNLRPALQHVEMQLAGNELTITALDGFTMIQKTIEVMGERDGECIVDPKSLIAMLSCMRGVAEVSADETMRIVNAGSGLDVSLRLYDGGSYLDHSKIWPAYDTSTSIYVNPDYLRKATDMLTDINDKAIKITIDAKDGHRPMTVETRNGDRALVLPLKVSVGWRGKEANHHDEQ